MLVVVLGDEAAWEGELPKEIHFEMAMGQGLE